MIKAKFIFLGIALLIALVGTEAFAQSGVVSRAQRITGDRFTHRVVTPAGATVYAVKQPSSAMLNAIDKGLKDLTAVARKNGYRRMVTPSEFTIFIAKPDRTKNGAEYSPDIAVGAGQYAGSDYDQGGYIYAAGMVVSNSPAAFVLAEHTRDLDRVSNVVRFEGEHIVLYHNDRRRYAETADHSRGGGHPILQ